MKAWQTRGDHLCEDGRSHRWRRERRAVATELGVVLGQDKVTSKSNEITAIPERLKALYIHGLLATINAMGCQKNIARQITDQGGGDLLAVKGNQPTLLDAIETEFIEQSPSEEGERHHQVHSSHGRIVAQIASVLPADGIVDLAAWLKMQDDRSGRLPA